MPQREPTGLEKHLNIYSVAHVLNTDGSLLCAWRCSKVEHRALSKTDKVLVLKEVILQRRDNKDVQQEINKEVSDNTGATQRM